MNCSHFAAAQGGHGKLVCKTKTGLIDGYFSFSVLYSEFHRSYIVGLRVHDTSAISGMCENVCLHRLTT